jgi:hypothetical protein
MDDFFTHDTRIEDGTALRDLEKKVHYLMSMLSNAGMLNDRFGNNAVVPDDLNDNTVAQDAVEVIRTLLNDGN